MVIASLANATKLTNDYDDGSVSLLSRDGLDSATWGFQFV